MSPSEIRQAKKLAATGLSKRAAQVILADARDYTPVEVLAAKIIEKGLQL